MSPTSKSGRGIPRVEHLRAQPDAEPTHASQPMRAVNDLSVTAVISPVNRIEVFRGIRTHADRQNLHRQEYRRLGIRALRQHAADSSMRRNPGLSAESAIAARSRGVKTNNARIQATGEACNLIWSRAPGLVTHRRETGRRSPQLSALGSSRLPL